MGKYQLREPWGKVVYQSVDFKKLLKKAYDKCDEGQITNYEIWVGYGQNLREFDKKIAGVCMEQWGGIILSYKGREYDVYADGSTSWHKGDPDPYGILDKDLIARREKYRQRIRSGVKTQHKSKSPLDEIDDAFEKGKKMVGIR